MKFSTCFLSSASARFRETGHKVGVQLNFFTWSHIVVGNIIFFFRSFLNSTVNTRRYSFFFSYFIECKNSGCYEVHRKQQSWVVDKFATNPFKKGMPYFVTWSNLSPISVTFILKIKWQLSTFTGSVFTVTFVLKIDYFCFYFKVLNEFCQMLKRVSIWNQLKYQSVKSANT